MKNWGQTYLLRKMRDWDQSYFYASFSRGACVKSSFDPEKLGGDFAVDPDYDFFGSEADSREGHGLLNHVIQA
jgi:hypothetical protein